MTEINYNKLDRRIDDFIYTLKALRDVGIDFFTIEGAVDRIIKAYCDENIRTKGEYQLIDRTTFVEIVTKLDFIIKTFYKITTQVDDNFGFFIYRFVTDCIEILKNELHDEDNAIFENICNPAYSTSWISYATIYDYLIEESKNDSKI